MVASAAFNLLPSIMPSLGTTALSAGGTAALSAMPTIASAAGAGANFATGAMGGGLSVGTVGLKGSGLGIMGSSGGLSALTEGGGGAAKAAKGFLGMDPKQAKFLSIMSKDVISPAAKLIANTQRDKKTGKLTPTGKALASLGSLADAYSVGHDLSIKLAGLAAPGQGTGTDGRPKTDPKDPKAPGGGEEASMRINPTSFGSTFNTLAF